MRWLSLAIVLGAAAAAPRAAAREAAGRVVVASGHPLLLEEEGGARRLVSPVPGAEITGVTALRDLAPGDAVRYAWQTERAGVRLADRVAVDPLLAIDVAMDVLAGKLEQELGTGAAAALDARPRRRWEAGHLPGALPVPADAPDAVLARALPAGKAVVVYGESARTREAHALARRLLALGRKDVRILRGGFREWDAEGLTVVADPAAVARDLAARRPIVALDVRPAAAAAAAPVAGALSIPLDDMRPGEFSDPRKMPPIVLVGDGDADADAVAAAGRIGRWRAAPGLPRWTLRVLAGGAAAWRRARLSAKIHATRAPLRWSAPPMEAAMGLDEFLGIWAEKGGGRAVLDVRKPPVNPAPWVRFVPLEELSGRLGELPRDREIVVYCSMGLRSAVAGEILARNGFRARYLADVLPDPLP